MCKWGQTVYVLVTKFEEEGWDYYGSIVLRAREVGG